MSTTKPANYEQAVKVLRGHLDSRYMRLDQFEAYTEGRQYAGLAHWLDDSEEPLLKRAPHIVQPIVDEAIKDFRDLSIPEWPDITSTPEEEDEDTESAAKGSEQLDALVSEVCKVAKLPTVGSEAFYRALSCGTAVTIASLVRGRVKATNVRAKWCMPKWSPVRPDELDELEIRYPYTKEEKRGGRVELIVYLFRRRITRTADTTFQPIEAKDGMSWEDYDEWVADPQRSVEHNLGFVPAVWWAFGKDEAFVGSDDGKPIHDLLLDEIDALNRSHSQHNRAALYAGDPQVVETGVQPDHNPAPTMAEGSPWRPHVDESPEQAQREAARWVGAQHAQSSKRRKGPTVVWRYPTPDAEVSLLTLPGDALEAIQSDTDRLTRMVADGLCWIRPDPGEFSKRGINFSNLSGEAMRWLYRRMTVRCTQFRQWFAEHWLTPLLGVFARILAKNANGAPLVATASAAPALVSQFEIQLDGDTEWIGLPLNYRWPRFFADTELDLERRSNRVRSDFEAGLITLETAVRQIAEAYDIDDAEAYAKLLEEEAKKKAEDLHETMRLAAGDESEDDGAGPPGHSGSGGRGDPKVPGGDAKR